MIGGIYCPLLSSDPQHRLNTLIKQTNSRVILTHWLTMSKFYDNNILLIDIDSILCNSIISNVDIDSLSNITITCEDIAYFIFTSGSTGIPKTTQIRHKNFLECIQSLYYIDLLNHKDTIIQMAQCSYDVHIQEILGTLMIGASLTMLHPQGNLDIDYILRILHEKQISYLQSVPAYLNNIDEFLLKYNKSKIFTLRNLDIGGKKFIPFAEIFNI
jgi:arthrofactin-type cyclic lipopeptide synthetase C